MVLIRLWITCRWWNIVKTVKTFTAESVTTQNTYEKENVLTVVTDVMCRLVDVYQHFRKTYCLHVYLGLQTDVFSWTILNPYMYFSSVTCIPCLYHSPNHPNNIRWKVPIMSSHYATFPCPLSTAAKHVKFQTAIIKQYYKSFVHMYAMLSECFWHTRNSLESQNL
jgi:hypothetical protein